MIMTPENPLYLNHSQSRFEDSITQGGYNPIENVYRYDPIPEVLDSSQARYILGAQGNMWSEYLNNTNKLEYMLFPRISALSEVLWSPKKLRDWAVFEKKLSSLMDRYKLWNVHYSTAYFDLQPSVIAGKKGKPAWKLDSRWPGGQIQYVIDSVSQKRLVYKGPINITRSGKYGATITNANQTLQTRWIWQEFKLNLASGKKIRLAKEPNKSYSLGGAFTLIDGIQNTQGMIRSSQFLGFNGKDMEAVIDLGRKTSIFQVVVHAFEQPGSWIYRPSDMTVSISLDDNQFSPIQSKWEITGSKNLLYSLPVVAKTRYIRIQAKNPGIIREGLPGAGHSAWIFFDEIEIY